MTATTALLLLLLAGGPDPAGRPEAVTCVAAVDGVPIVEQELRFALPPGATSGLHHPAARDSTRAAVRSALHRAVDAKVRLLLAVEAGLLPGADYDAFRRAWESENASRELRKQAGETVYGPLRWSERAFYEYRLASIGIALAERTRVSPPAGASGAGTGGDLPAAMLRLRRAAASISIDESALERFTDALLEEQR